MGINWNYEYFILLIVEISIFYYNYGEYSETVAPAKRHRKETKLLSYCRWRLRLKIRFQPNPLQPNQTAMTFTMDHSLNWCE